MTPKQLAAMADDLFSKRGTYMSLLQEIAENFYPERADFTFRREVGDEWGGNLSSSYPLIVRREFGDSLGVMLRDPQRPWFHQVPEDKSLAKDHEVRQRIEFQEEVMRRAMYDRTALFTQTMKMADHDFACFGTCPLSIELNRKRDGLLYRAWHIRDVVWVENEEGQICFVARRWKAQVKDLTARYGSGELHREINDKVHKEPFAEVNLYHIVCDADMVDKNPRGLPRCSVTYDRDHNEPIRLTPIKNKHYIIPRWQLVSGSQYPYSPATIVALPDARLIQAMSYTLLEAGEKATNPPMVATMDAVRSDVSIYAGGITWVDQQYDERLGEALRPLAQDYRALPFGIEMLQDTRQLLEQAFFINKLRAFNPSQDPEMTAFQAGQLVQQYIRGALPLFEPVEQEYSAQICEETFDLMMANGAFGPPSMIPAQLRGADLGWRFESPLHDAMEAQKGTKFLEMRQLIGEALALDESAVALPDTITALRDALDGIQVPAEWTRTEVDVKQINDARQAAQQNAQLQEQLRTTAGAAKDMGAAQKDMAMAAPV